MRHNAGFFLIAFYSFGGFACNESLPVYSSPENILQAMTVPLNSPEDTVRYFMRDNNNPNLVTVRLDSPFNGYEVKIVNTFDETVQDDADVQGKLELSWKDKTTLTAEIPITITNFYSSHYDPSNGLITINPGDTARLRVFWNFKLTTSDWAFTQQQSVDGNMYYVGPLSSEFKRYHLPMEFQMKLHVKIFRSLGYIDAVSKENDVVLFQGTVRNPP